MTEQLANKECVPCRELADQGKERRMRSLEQDLIAAAKGPTIKLSLTDIRKKGLLAVLRNQASKKRM